MSSKPPAIDVRQLRQFVAVAETLSFRRASETLRTAQPAITRQIKALETTMQVRLLDRNSRHVALTPPGLVVLGKAKEIIRDLDVLVDVARQIAAGHTQTLRLGFGSHAAYHFVPQIVRPFRAARPEIGIDLQRFMASNQFGPLLERIIDVAILRPLYADPRVSTYTIKRTRFLAALPAGHLLLKKASVRMAELRNEDFVMPRKHVGPSYHGQILGFCLDAGFTPRSIVEADDVQAMIGTVATGYGVTIIPETAAALRVSGVDYRPLAGLSQTADFALAWRRDENRESVNEFVELAIRTCQSGSAKSKPQKSKSGMLHQRHSAPSVSSQ